MDTSCINKEIFQNIFPLLKHTDAAVLENQNCKNLFKNIKSELLGWVIPTLHYNRVREDERCTCTYIVNIKFYQNSHGKILLAHPETPVIGSFYIIKIIYIYICIINLLFTFQKIKYMK